MIYSESKVLAILEQQYSQNNNMKAAIKAIDICYIKFPYLSPIPVFTDTRVDVESVQNYINVLQKYKVELKVHKKAIAEYPTKDLQEDIRNLIGSKYDNRVED